MHDLSDSNVDFTALDYRALPPEQKDAVRRQILRDARQARSHLFAALMRALPGTLIGIAARSWQRLAAYHRRRKAAKALHALDDRLLRDMGIGRSEIWSVTRGRAYPSRRLRGPETRQPRCPLPAPHRCAA